MLKLFSWAVSVLEMATLSKVRQLMRYEVAYYLNSFFVIHLVSGYFRTFYGQEARAMNQAQWLLGVIAANSCTLFEQTKHQLN